MKRIVMSACLATLLAFGGVSAAVAEDSVDWTALPADEASLTALDTQQTRLLRNAVRHCNDLARSNHQVTPCVFLDVDRAVRTGDDAALRAYHFALPRSMRYDENRNTGFAVKRVMEQRPSPQD